MPADPAFSCATSNLCLPAVRGAALLMTEHTLDSLATTPRLAWRWWVLALIVGLAVLGAGLAEAQRWSAARSALRAPVTGPLPPAAAVALTAVSNTLIPMPPGVPSAHASSLATTSGEGMLAFWWAGSRESGPDVKVYASRWSGASWGVPYEVASRESLAAALGFGVRRIGNPVAWTARDGTVNLFVVATGMGGWAASRVVHLVSADQGLRFTPRRILQMSPMFNTSALVRSAPLALPEGGWWLPVYFELGIKYPMIMAFDELGDPRWLTRIGARTTTLQPTIVALSDSHAHAWMRDASDERRVQQATTSDGGVSWQDLPPLDLPNYSTSLAALRLSGGGFLLLHNHVVPGGSDRNMLRLSASSDARNWTPVLDVARGAPGREFSYPTLQQVGEELHVTYTSHRTAIAHHVYRIGYGKNPP